MRRTRREMLALSPLLAVGACGFHPVYGSRSATASPDAQAGLAAIMVDIIPERSGQLLRQALQERFERFGGPAARRYGLRASVNINDDAIALQTDSTVTRVRVVGYAEYSLASLSGRQTITSGSARAVDGLDVINQQYFAADQTHEAVVRRLAEALADQIALQLATHFDAHGLA